MGKLTRSDDPAFALLLDNFTSTPTTFRRGCYICEDHEYAQMGLPLCYKCDKCKGHVPADDPTCDDCGHDHSAGEGEHDA